MFCLSFTLKIEKEHWWNSLVLTAEAHGVISHKNMIVVRANRVSNLKQKVDQNEGCTFLVISNTRIKKGHWNYVFKFSIIRQKYGITGNEKIRRAVTFGIKRMLSC